MSVTLPDCWNDSDRLVGASTFPVEVTLSRTVPFFAVASVSVVADELGEFRTAANVAPPMSTSTTTSAVFSMTRRLMSVTNRRRRAATARGQQRLARLVRRRELRVRTQVVQRARPRGTTRATRAARHLDAVVLQARRVRLERLRVLASRCPARRSAASNGTPGSLPGTSSCSHRGRCRRGDRRLRPGSETTRSGRRLPRHRGDRHRSCHPTAT